MVRPTHRVVAAEAAAEIAHQRSGHGRGRPLMVVVRCKRKQRRRRGIDPATLVAAFQTFTLQDLLYCTVRCFSPTVLILSVSPVRRVTLYCSLRRFPLLSRVRPQIHDIGPGRRPSPPPNVRGFPPSGGDGGSYVQVRACLGFSPGGCDRLASASAGRGPRVAGTPRHNERRTFPHHDIGGHIVLQRLYTI